MNLLVRDPQQFQKRFNTSLEEAQNNAENLAYLMKRLKELGPDCASIKLSIRGKPFIVLKDGEDYILVEPTEY
ncbi:hypothetical protein KY309_02810 [Candidatus Woesearchaeota archaeon]|nr:hypothetical protein [Candidatus Woesearchaeota archaeon]MBW3016516.1 hypothetical protein [Candidatus Woesearchaeota archaeon]